ncbi:hypothetical protein MPH_08165 [Macrophomina phaseolina MS6]|uniref:Uncharacterized protein n=1 Tax=Macrophomina phaseolina (strain MS6) TaxID=1126212 RepID=K2RPI4_MACPH|nr:hypothetical protein MPH_08165 [Macrophomina phaseolina MS6]
MMRSFGSTVEHCKASCSGCGHVPCDSCIIPPGNGFVKQLVSDEIQLNKSTDDRRYLYFCSCGTPNFVEPDSKSVWKRLQYLDTTSLSFKGRKCMACANAYLPSFLKLAPVEEDLGTFEAEEDEEEEEADRLEDEIPQTGQFFPQGYSDLPSPLLLRLNPLAFATEILLPAPPNTPVEPKSPVEDVQLDCNFVWPYPAAEQASPVHDPVLPSLIDGNEAAPRQPKSAACPATSRSDSAQEQPPSHELLPQQPYNKDDSHSPDNNETSLENYLRDYRELQKSGKLQFLHPNNSDSRVPPAPVFLVFLLSSNNDKNTLALESPLVLNATETNFSIFEGKDIDEYSACPNN